jgi:hypothetical protein
VDVQALFDLDERVVDANTAFGPMEISAPEPKRAAPGQDIVPHPTRLVVENWIIKSFELTARIHSIALALAEEAKPDLGPDDDAPRSAVPQDYRADLTFGDGAEVLFRLHGLGDEADLRPGIGRISLGWISDGQPVGDEYGPRYSVPLEDGELNLWRCRDLARLTYRFSGVDLVLDGDFHLIRPRGLARSQDINAMAAGGPAIDPRPLMVVELPPQHVAEEAFFEQRKPRPTLPRYPIASLDPTKKLRSFARTIPFLRVPMNKTSVPWRGVRQERCFGVSLIK